MDDTFGVLLDSQRVHAHLPLRAMLDCVRFAEELGHDAVLAAVKAVLATGAVELPVVLAHAKLTKVRKPLLRLLVELSVDLSADTRDG